MLLNEASPNLNHDARFKRGNKILFRVLVTTLVIVAVYLLFQAIALYTSVAETIKRIPDRPTTEIESMLAAILDLDGPPERRPQSLGAPITRKIHINQTWTNRIGGSRVYADYYVKRWLEKRGLGAAPIHLVEPQDNPDLEVYVDNHWIGPPKVSTAMINFVKLPQSEELRAPWASSQRLVRDGEIIGGRVNLLL
jgi:hypothetical protein